MPEPWPERSTANKFPARILTENAPKRRSTAQKAADDAAAAEKAKKLREDAEKEYQMKIKKIAEMEDTLRHQDLSYSSKPSVPPEAASDNQATIPMTSPDDLDIGQEQEMILESELEGDEFEPDTGSETSNESDEEDLMDIGEDSNNEGKKTKRKGKGQRVAKATKVVSVFTLSLRLLSKEHRDQSKGQFGTMYQRPSSKRLKGKQLASNLAKDWKKQLPQLPKTPNTSTSRRTRDLPDDDEPVVLPPLPSAKSRSSSRSSFSQITGTSSEQQIEGEFDEDEPPERTAAARRVKTQAPSVRSKRTIGGLGNVEAGRTTKTMGLKLEVKEADEAVREVKLAKPKPLKSLKATDLPIWDDKELAAWEGLIRALIDWAGSLKDSFGTSEHPDLMSTIQALWDLYLKDSPVKVSEYPAIRKLATDRLNNWCSEMGKRGLKYLERTFKDTKYRNDVDARAEFVNARLPCVVNGQPHYPLIYGDLERSKGSWESPLVLAILSYHIQHTGNAFQMHGPPCGALAVATASWPFNQLMHPVFILN
ncbi:hypothetical protein HYDPIDRAFT_171392 [Hydnomerulius pinastri MD-312]|uniref:Uncharacterized protein n=1 Tax=Hydnomerulius pinastri MD-312 TaxID=994086 RepID=A0A0C9W644_9AGAM|nr:hypothetical protein HYDPIDRAFT_171392 [Hydnomerulius pinastri MD-312]